MTSDPSRPPPRPVAPPGKVATPDQLPTVEPGEWPAQPPNAVHPVPDPPPPPAAGPAAPPPPPPVPPAPVPMPLPAGPPPPYAPPPRRLAWVWLTLAAAVVLVVGLVGAVAVVRPWDSDDTVAGPGAGPADLDLPGDDDQAPAEPPADPPSTSAPPAPPPVAVTGDLNGDGYGDAALVVADGDDLTRVDLASTGRSFKAMPEPVATLEDRTWADFDGDGTLDRVSWSFEFGGTLSLTSEDLDLGEAALRLQLDERFPFVTLRPGDLDGDGAVDLVAYGATGARRVTVWMIRNDGDGFEQPVVWARLADTAYGLTTLLVGDFSGDGRDDAVVQVPERVPGPGRRAPDPAYGYRMLTSSGEAFMVGPFQPMGDALSEGSVVTGGFARDGAPLLVLLSERRDGIRVRALRWTDGVLVADRRWRSRIAGDDLDLADVVVSDVDGDGLDDAVIVTVADDGSAYGGVRVLRSTGAGLDPAGVWAPAPDCRPADCSVYFQNGY